MIGAAKRYREILTTLLMERELARGSLSDDEESRYVEELDRCWWAMTDSEQTETERAIAGNEPIGGPADLGAEDVVVAPGEHRLPRQAA
ncbi:MAG TPA: hypothetical protein VH142_21980 [Polyangiaceae bacterium]|jgi:hypothetical protein|nr:hypothetical protein [Polyangiaceae bacterium]